MIGKPALGFPVVTGGLLLLLLVFATSTVFVKAAWALQSFQVGVYVVVAGYVLLGIRRDKEPLAKGVVPWIVYLIPLWGVVQLIAHTTASSMETRAETLKWGSLAGVFFLSQVVGRSRSARRVVLDAFLSFAAVMAVLCIVQLFASEGKVLWIFPSGYPDVYATFPNHNNYAQFAELALPIALWWALREGWRAWGYAVISGVIYASVIAAASRAGAILCTAEVALILLIGLVQALRGKAGSLNATAAILAMMFSLAALFTFAVGWNRIWKRFQGNDPYVVRREFIASAIRMAETRPLTGFGLGTFPEVYQKFALKDFPFYANHAHNDWAEFAADGGVPFLLLVLVPFAFAVPTAFRHPWGLGIVFVMVHALVDYPFPRPAVSGWMFAMLALLYMARTHDLKNGRTAALRTAESAKVFQLK